MRDQDAEVLEVDVVDDPQERAFGGSRPRSPEASCVTGVSTSMRKMPSRKPTTMAQRQPLALSRFKNTPKKKTTKIGGAR